MELETFDQKGIDDALSANGHVTLHTGADAIQKARELTADVLPDADPEPEELFAAAEAAEGAARNRHLKALAAAVAGEPLDAETMAERVRKANLAPKGAFLAAVNEARRQAPRPQSQRPATASPAGPYRIEDGRHTWDRDTQSGPVPVALCNFTAEIIAEEVRDDGAERTTLFQIAGRLQNGEPLSTAPVPAERYAGMGWVPAHWGTRAVVYAGVQTKDHLRVAIQLHSGDVPRRTIYGHLGWRRFPAGWHYLHGGGAIGPVGPLGPDHEIEVALDERLAAYTFPPEDEEAALAEAVRGSLALLAVAPIDVAYPLLASIYRAPLAEALPIDYSVFVVGATGAQKSELTALAQAHFGAAFHAKSLPGNWSSSANALERQAFLTKDAVFTVDDFAPGGTTADVQRMHREADRLLRAQGNRSGRGRLRPDGSLRPVYFPRGLILSSGEDIPAGQSLRARLLIVEVERGDVDLAQLTSLQDAARAGTLARAMAEYLRWLAPQMDALPETLRQRHADLRTRARAGGAMHDRTPDLLASLAIGLQWFLRFALDRQVITKAQAAEYWRTGWETLRRVAGTQGEHQRSEEPVQRFLSLLSGLFSSGLANVVSAKNDGVPDEPGAWGWQEVEVGTGEYFRREWKAKGTRLGWIEGEDLYLEPEMTFAAVQRLARDQSGSFPLTQTILWKRLAEKGVLQSREESRYTIRRQLGDRRVRVLHLNAAHLSTETGPSGPTGPEGPPQAREWTENVDHFSAPPAETGPQNRSTAGPSRHEDPPAGPLGPVGPLLGDRTAPALAGWEGGAE